MNYITKLLNGMRKTNQAANAQMLFEMDGSEVSSALVPVGKERQEVAPKFFKPLKNGIDDIVYPLINPDDDEQVATLTKYTEGVRKTFVKYKHVDVCVIRDLVDELNIRTTAQGDRYMSILRKLHCVDFSNLPPGLAEKLPHMFNFIASSGQVTHPCLETSIDVEALSVKSK